jgi:hypothetical protein
LKDIADSLIRLFSSRQWKQGSFFDLFFGILLKEKEFRLMLLVMKERQNPTTENIEILKYRDSVFGNG